MTRGVSIARLSAPLALPMLSGRCGPSEELFGALVVQSLLPAVLLGLALHWVFARSDEDPRAVLRVNGVLLAISLAGLLLVAGDVELNLLGLAVAGVVVANYLALLGVALLVAPHRYRPHGMAVVFGLLALPGFWFYLRATPGRVVSRFWEDLYVWPGIAGCLVICVVLIATTFFMRAALDAQRS